MDDFSNMFDVSCMENEISKLSDEDKLEYLINRRNFYIDLCYHWDDKSIGSMIESSDLKHLYEPIPYFVSMDLEQTHISRSLYIKFLRHLNDTLLPFARKRIFELDPDIKEDTSKIIKDYPVFNFDYEKVLDYSETLKEDKVAYLEWILLEYDHLRENNSDLDPYLDNINSDFLNAFVDALNIRISSIKRYPDKVYPRLSRIEILEEENEEISEDYKNDPLLFEFKINKIKEHVKSLSSQQEQIYYLEYVKKEAKQYREIFSDIDYIRLEESLNIEIEFYSSKLLSSSSKKDIVESNKKLISNIEPVTQNNNLIKIKWNKENVLLPYLFQALFEEGFISESDYKVRHKFIEQSFNKKNGLPFTFKISDQSESNYKTNTKTKRKPKNAFMVDNVIAKVKKRSRKK